MSAENSEEALNSRHACAACKHQRKKCENHCVFAPHFPANRANCFREVHKIFGVKNVTGILEHLSPQEREKAVESLEWEAFAWKEDPVQGPLGLFRKLERELELLKNQQNSQQNILVPYTTKSGLIAYNHNFDGFVANNNNINATNFVSDVPMNSYAGFLQKVDNIENQGLDNHIPVGAYYSIPPQAQGRSAMLQERSLDAVDQITTFLPKQEMQRNKIPGSSIMRPAVNYHQRGKQGRVHAYLDGSVNGSQGRGLHYKSS